MTNYSIGLSGLTTSQRALEILGQNLANVNTPSYHRQTPGLAALYYGDLVGSGVEIANVGRAYSRLLESAVTRSTADASDLATRLQSLRQLESTFLPGDSSLGSLLTGFFNELEALTSHPEDLTQRTIVMKRAGELTDRFNSLTGELNQMHSGVDKQLQATVSEINDVTTEIARLNDEIQRAELQGQQANAPRDIRDELLSRLARLINVRTVEVESGKLNVFSAGVPLVLGSQTIPLQLGKDAAGKAFISSVGSTKALAVGSGKLAGDLDVYNNVLPEFQQEIDALAQELARSFDQLQATGIGLNGPLSAATSHRKISNVTVPLNQAKPVFPLQAGSLFISVTDTATGQRTLSEIVIDPATQSLQDLATAISGVTHLQGSVDPQTGALKILAEPGYAFDFAGRIATTPEAIAITGTTVPQVAGTYTATANDILTYRVVGSGTVGVSPNLSLEVSNSAGTIVGTFNVGAGYEPGSKLSLENGLTVQLSAGTANDGDSFVTTVVGQPDTSGVLVALGLNTFFVGSSAVDLAVNPALLADPELLAASRSGQPGDSSNLLRMTALRDDKALGNGSQTFNQFADAMIGDIGARVQDTAQRHEAIEVLGQQLEAERQSVSGVDPNEELVHVMQFQRSFQMAARYISVVNETLDDLLLLVG